MDGAARSEHPEDDPEDGRWLSYVELGQIRGISRESAIRLARREKWRRIRGNDGTARIFCPGDWLKSSRKNPGDQSPGQPTNYSPDPGDAREDLSHAINSLGEAVGVLREQLTAERERANRAEAAHDIALAQLRMAEELLKEAQIERAVEDAAQRSWLFRWRRR